MMKKQVGKQFIFPIIFISTLQVGCVTVLVPPDIDQNLSSGDVTVTEVRRDMSYYSVTV